MATSAEAERVEIVVLNWNGRDDTLECLASLQRIDYPNFGVIVVDNGSTDGSAAAIRSRFPAVRIVETGENLGFAEGNNRGIRQALDRGADYLLVLNNDTVVDTQILSAFADSARQAPGAGILGAKIYYYADRQCLWFAGGEWDPQTMSFRKRGSGERDEGQYDLMETTDWIVGCAMFVRARVFAEVGLLEPSFFLNNEEIDFCSRAQRAGHSCLYVPTARLWHKVSRAFGGDQSPMKEYFIARNRLLWASRNADAALRWRIYRGALAGVARRFLRPMASLPRGSASPVKSWWWSVRASYRDPRNRAFFLGTRDFVLRRFGDCPESVRQLSREWSSHRAPALPK